MEELKRWNFEGIGFRAVLALTPEEREASYRLRYKEFVDCPNPRFSRENCSNGLETDRFDAYSHHILLFRDDSFDPISNIRLIDGSRGPFFIEGQDFSGVSCALPQTVDGEAVLHQSTYEAGRWIGTNIKLPGGTRVLLSRMVLSAALDFSWRLGVRHWYGAINSDAAERMRKGGIRMFPIVPGLHRFLDRDNLELIIMPVDTYVFPVSVAPEDDS